MRRKLIALGIFSLYLYIMFLSDSSLKSESFELAEYYISNAYTDTGAPNAVTSIYLFYRYYDTIFEALMLMFSIVGIIYMSVHEEEIHNDR